MLASARSMPSPSATTVGPSPAEPTSAFSTRSAPDSTHQLADPLLAREHLAVEARRGPLGRVGVGERDAPDAVLARLLEQPLPRRWRPRARRPRGRPRRATTSSACTPIDPVEPRIRTFLHRPRECRDGPKRRLTSVRPPAAEREASPARGGLRIPRCAEARCASWSRARTGSLAYSGEAGASPRQTFRGAYPAGALIEASHATAAGRRRTAFGRDGRTRRSSVSPARSDASCSAPSAGPGVRVGLVLNRVTLPSRNSNTCSKPASSSAPLFALPLKRPVTTTVSPSSRNSSGSAAELVEVLGHGGEDVLADAVARRGTCRSGRCRRPARSTRCCRHSAQALRGCCRC